MGKKRERKPTAKNGKPQQHAQKPVADMAADIAVSKLNQQLQVLAMRLQQDQQQALRGIYVRLMTLEGIIQDKLKVSDTELAELVADTEDKAAGLLKVTDSATEKGDTLRLTVATKAKDHEEFQGESKLVVDNVGNEPYTIGPELEPKLIGLKINDAVELEFGKDGGMVAKIEVNRISRRPAPKKVEKAEEKTEAKQETIDESKNEG